MNSKLHRVTRLHGSGTEKPPQKRGPWLTRMLDDCQMDAA
jgi:hypothetical protein